MHIVSTNFAKTLIWKQEYDFQVWHHKQQTRNRNDHYMPLNELLLPWKVPVYATASVGCTNEIFVEQKSANRLSKGWKALPYRIKNCVRRAAKLGLLEQQTSLLIAMKFLSLRSANISLIHTVALHTRSLGPPWTKQRCKALKKRTVSLEKKARGDCLVNLPNIHPWALNLFCGKAHVTEMKLNLNFFPLGLQIPQTCYCIF